MFPDQQHLQLVAHTVDRHDGAVVDEGQLVVERRSLDLRQRSWRWNTGRLAPTFRQCEPGPLASETPAADWGLNPTNRPGSASPRREADNRLLKGRGARPLSRKQQGVSSE